jgi:hypothetical protein
MPGTSALKILLCVFVTLACGVAGAVGAEPEKPAGERDTAHPPAELPAEVTTHQVLELAGRSLRFSATAGVTVTIRR